MKITIDTKTDSDEEIKKAIMLLSSLIGHKNEEGEFDVPESENMMGMFDSDKHPEEEKKDDDVNIVEYD